MSESKFIKANEKIAEAVTGGYQKIEDGVVGAYKKVEDAFVGKFLTHEGESIEAAKERLAREQAVHEEAGQEAAEKRADIAGASVKTSLERAKASVEANKNAGKH